jgi:lipopolysaccharide transport system ATP-binding protein
VSETIIKVDHVSKRYRIGLKEKGYKTLREAIVDGFKAPLRNFRRLGRLTKFESGSFSEVKEIKENGLPPDVIWAVRDVSFEVKKGEVFGIIGRNGAGKSTLLKILSRITEPTSGEVKIYGRVSSLLEVGTGFHPELSGRENVYLNGTVLGMKKREIDKKFDEIVSFAEIDRFLDTPVKRYSSGMYVRLAFAVAAHLEPEILLVDEVLAVGDAAFQKKCLGKMGDVAREGRTVLFVSHNMGAVSQLCGLTMWLHNGQVFSILPTAEVIKNYLSYGTSDLPEVRWPHEPNKDGQYLRARVLDSHNQLSSELSCDEAITVEITFLLRKKIPGIYLTLHLRNAEGISVLFSDSSDMLPNPASNLEAGLYAFRVAIPPRLLAPGRYYFTVSSSTRERLIDSRHEPCTFVLRDLKTRRENRPGCLGTLMSWRLEPVVDTEYCEPIKGN